MAEVAVTTKAVGAPGALNIVPVTTAVFADSPSALIALTFILLKLPAVTELITYVVPVPTPSFAVA